jgi:hypothetical protein
MRIKRVALLLMLEFGEGILAQVSEAIVALLFSSLGGSRFFTGDTTTLLCLAFPQILVLFCLYLMISLTLS